MKIELHILQNFAPSNLNRDDTGAPKDCELGGYRRARISSQCLKRAARELFRTGSDFDQSELAVRTKRLVENVVQNLTREHKEDTERAAAVVAATLAGAKLKAGKDHKTEYLLFVPRRHIERLAELIDRHWDELAALASGSGTDEVKQGAEKTKRDRGSRSEKAEKERTVPKEIAKELVEIFEDVKGAPELALFGRMIADRPEWNVNAACQVAHAISTNRVSMDFDFYTAVDDLKPADTAGSDMMGTMQFNSSCFYRYSVLDIDELRKNLEGAEKLVAKTAAAYLRASVLAVPSGKQNSMAAHNPPSFVLALPRANGTPISLANAFLQPVRPRTDADLVTASIDAMLDHLQSVFGMFELRCDGLFIADRPVVLPAKSESLVKLENTVTLAALTDAVVGRISGARA